MIRWAAVLFVVVASAVALAGTYGYDGRREGSIVDEVLTYEITPRDAISAKVPAGIETVLLTLWAVLPPHEVGEPDATYEYGVGVKLSDVGGTPVKARPYGTVSRVSTPQDHATAQGFSARLVDSEDWVTDPRTVEVDTQAIAKLGGTIQVRALDGAHPVLLSRLSYRFRRGRLEQELVERSLDLESIGRILGQTTALGFVDLPPRARRNALSSWSRRLTADGRAGRDYRVRRLLVGDHRALSGRVEARVLDVAIAPARMAVLNLLGPTELRVLGRPGLELRVREGEQMERAVAIGDAGHVDLDLRDDTLRSVFIASTVHARVRLSLHRQQIQNQIGDVEHVVYPDGRVLVAPDVRAHTYYRLSPDEGLIYPVAPGQGPFRLQLRAILDNADPPYSVRGSVSATWSDRRRVEHRAQHVVELIRSRFETFGELGHASDATVAYLYPPEGVDRLELHGDRSLVVSAAVGEPGVEQGIVESPYLEAPLALDQYWKYAPYALSRWSTTRPFVDEGKLVHRTVKLQAQARLEYRFAPIPGSLPQRALLPRGAPVRRRLLTERPLISLEEDESRWFELAPTTRLVVEDVGPRARRIRLHYFAAAEALGGRLSVSVDGEPRHEQRLVVQSGRVDVPATAGVHVLHIEGLGRGGTVYADVRPVGATQYIERHYLAELAPGKPLVFSAPSAPGAVYSVVLFAATEGVEKPIRIEYTVDGGAVERLPGVFFQYQTEAQGALEAVSGDFERGLILEGNRAAPPRVSAAPDGVSRLRVRLGDDLARQGHRIVLRLPRRGGGPERVWVRAVLVGENAPETQEMHRAWTQEVP